MTSKSKVSNIVIAGVSGAGKDTLVNHVLSLTNFKHGVVRAVSTTTRPIGPNERDGVDYHFASDDEFEKTRDQGLFAETAEYDVCGHIWKYGSLKKDYEPDGQIHLFILNPYGIQQLIDNGIEFTLVYIDLPMSVSYERMVSRGRQSKEQMGARLVQDLDDFRDFADKYHPDVVIKGDQPIESFKKSFAKTVAVNDEWLSTLEKGKDNTSKGNKTEDIIGSVIDDVIDKIATGKDSRTVNVSELIERIAAGLSKADVHKDEFTAALDKATLAAKRAPLIKRYKNLIQTAERLVPDMSSLGILGELDESARSLKAELKALGYDISDWRLPSDAAKEVAAAKLCECYQTLYEVTNCMQGTPEWFGAYHAAAHDYKNAVTWMRIFK